MSRFCFLGEISKRGAGEKTVVSDEYMSFEKSKKRLREGLSGDSNNSLRLQA
jgi:hypothetical protein